MRIELSISLYGHAACTAGRSGVGKYNAESSKQDSKRFNLITKTSHFSHLGILFIYCKMCAMLTTVYMN